MLLYYFLILLCGFKVYSEPNLKERITDKTPPAIQKLYFATSNAAKFNEIKQYLSKLNSSIELEQYSIDIPEQQCLDVHSVAQNKARYAYSILKKPLLVDDEGLYLKSYNQFPGALLKFVHQGIGLAGIYKLAQDNPAAYFKGSLVYITDYENIYTFEGTCYGKIIDPQNITNKVPTCCADIFIPESYNKTYSELKTDANFATYRYKSLKALVNFLDSCHMVK